MAGQRQPGALAPLHVAHAHHHRTDEAQPRRGGEAARRGALRAAPLLPPLQPGQQDLRDAAWLNSANLAPWRRFMWLTLTTTAPTEAQPRRGGEAQQGGGRCVLPPWGHESRVSGFVTKTRTRMRHTAPQGRYNCARFPQLGARETLTLTYIVLII